MSELRQRVEPIRSRKLLDSARGQPCSLEFVGVCNHDPETVVSCHIHDDSFGLGVKADDSATVFGCANCHRFMDQGGWIGKISQAVLLRHILRALLRTQRNRIDRGLIVIPRDIDRPHHDKPTPPRKPPEQRAKIAQRANPWPPKGSRKIVNAPLARQRRDG